MKKLTRLLITLKSIRLHLITLSMIPLKERVTQKILKRRLQLVIAMSLFTLPAASTLTVPKSKREDQELVDQASTLTAKDLKQEKLAETVA
jgi:hypothetical protein